MFCLVPSFSSDVNKFVAIPKDGDKKISFFSTAAQKNGLQRLTNPRFLMIIPEKLECFINAHLPGNEIPAQAANDI